MRAVQRVVGGGERRDGRQRSGVDLPLGRLGFGDVPCGEEAVREAGDEVGSAVGGGVIAVARALFLIRLEEVEEEEEEVERRRKKNIVRRN